MSKQKITKLDVEIKFANLFLEEPDIYKLKNSGLVSESGKSTYKLIGSEYYPHSKHVLVVIGGKKQKILHNFNPFIVVNENTIRKYIDEIEAAQRLDTIHNYTHEIEAKRQNDEVEGIEMNDMSHVTDEKKRSYGGKKSRKTKSRKTRKTRKTK